MGIVFSITAITPAEAGEEAVGENELRFVATNFSFDKPEYRVKAGETLTLSLKNQLGTHGVAIEELGIQLMEGDTVEYTFDKPGEYNVVCSVMCGIGHAEMVSKLIVE
jgi:cytochrome c oxidase subunit 2